MSKKMIAAVLALTIAASFTACGKGNEGAQEGSTAGVTTVEAAGAEENPTMKPVQDADPDEYIVLPDISAMKITVPPEAEVTDEMIEEEYQRYIDSLTTLKEVEGRDVAQTGDIVNIDYSEPAVEEGAQPQEAEGYDLELGSGVFTETVESAIAGMKKGETKTISFTYPDDYYDESLQGKESQIEVTLNKIRQYETPEINDETVRGLNLVLADGTKVTTVSGLKEYVGEYAADNAREESRYSRQTDAIVAVIEATEVKKEYPEEMMNASLSFMLDGAGMQNEELDDETRQALNSYAKDYITEQLIYRKVAQEQGLTATESEIYDYLKDLYGDDYKAEEEDLTADDLYSYQTMILRSKVGDYILKTATLQEGE